MNRVRVGVAGFGTVGRASAEIISAHPGPVRAPLERVSELTIRRAVAAIKSFEFMVEPLLLAAQ